MNDAVRMVFAGSFLAGPFQPFCYFPISVEITDESLFFGMPFKRKSMMLCFNFLSLVDVQLLLWASNAVAFTSVHSFLSLFSSF
jgi:hypothetical protein